MATRFITIGSKGTFCFSASADADGDLIPTIDENGQAFEFAGFVLYGKQANGESVRLEWKGKQGDSLLGKALGAWVSNAGGTVRILPLALALSKGLVHKYALVADGGKVTAYLPKADYAVEKFPRILGTDCRLGRIENYRAKADGRQAGTAREEIALA